MEELRFCPYCGGRLVERLLKTEDRPRLVCDNCEQVLYQNPRIVAAALPINGKGVVLLRRGIEPRRGAWTFPSGYMELGESLEEAAIRETKEETNLDIELTALLDIYSRREAGVVVVVFLARVLGGQPSTSRESLEVAEFAPDQVPWDELAFPSTFWALEAWASRALNGNGSHVVEKDAVLDLPELNPPAQ
ncbi:MAG: NUDIX hydrolase [Chloroflexota bacterium]|nr:MAG: NUDIX hydrolase [Chloroflexota bacterium]